MRMAAAFTNNNAAWPRSDPKVPSPGQTKDMERSERLGSDVMR
jgi:hypothetical protein